MNANEQMHSLVTLTICEVRNIIHTVQDQDTKERLREALYDVRTAYGTEYVAATTTVRTVVELNDLYGAEDDARRKLRLKAEETLGVVAEGTVKELFRLLREATAVNNKENPTPNLQNIPVRTEMDKRLHDAFRAHTGI